MRKGGDLVEVARPGERLEALAVLLGLAHHPDCLRRDEGARREGVQGPPPLALFELLEVCVRLQPLLRLALRLTLLDLRCKAGRLQRDRRGIETEAQGVASRERLSPSRRRGQGLDG